MQVAIEENVNYLLRRIKEIDGETLKKHLIKIFGYSAAIYLIYVTSKQVLSTIVVIKRNKVQYKNLPSPPGNWFFGTIGQVNRFFSYSFSFFIPV